MTYIVPDLPDVQRSRAVLLGVSRYRGGLEAVPAVANNLASMRETLRRADLLGLPDPHITTLGDAELADVDAIPAVLDHLRQRAAEAPGTLVFYFAGHGLVDEHAGDDLYLAMPGTSDRHPSYTALPFRQVSRVISKARALQKVIILDCCFSGAALAVSITASGRGAPLASNGMAMLTSSPPGSPSLVGADGVYTSFTAELLRLLTGGVSGGPELLSMDVVYKELFGVFRAGRLTEPGVAYRGGGPHIALVRNLRHEPSAGAAGKPVSDPAGLATALERVLASMTHLRGAVDPAAADQVAGWQAVVTEVVAALRSGRDVSTSAVLAVDASIRAAGELLEELPALAADRPPELVNEAAVAVRRQAHLVQERQARTLARAYERFVSGLPAVCEEEVLAAAERLRTLDAEQVTEDLWVAEGPPAELAEAYRSAVYERLTAVFASDLRKRLERRLARDWAALIEETVTARRELGAALDGDPPPWLVTDAVDLRAVLDKAMPAAGVAALLFVAPPVVALPAIGLLTVPPVRRAIWKAFRAAVARRITARAAADLAERPAARAKLVATLVDGLAGAARSAVRRTEADLAETAGRAGAGPLAELLVKEVPTNREIVDDAAGRVTDALE